MNLTEMTIEQKAQQAEKMEEMISKKGMPVIAVATATGLSRWAVWKYVKLIRKHGKQGLIYKMKRSKQSRAKTSNIMYGAGHSKLWDKDFEHQGLFNEFMGISL